MSWWSRLGNVFRADRVNRDIEEEQQAHIDEAIAMGRDLGEARRALGPALRQREESRDARVMAWLDSLRADAIFGWRQLWKRKATSMAAIVSLGLAIGACTAAFRLMDALLLRPLPVAHPERLFVMAREGMDPGGHFRVSEAFEYPLFQRLRALVKDQAELIAISYASRSDLTYASDQDMEKAWRQYVSGWMFDAFGLKPALGRLFTESDDVTPDARPYAVLSYDYWTRRFGRDAHVLGRTLRMGSTLYEIVGVAPESFRGTETGTAVDIFLPTMMNGLVSDATSSWFRAFVALRPGVEAEPVRQRMYAPYQDAQVERSRNFHGVPQKQIENFLHQTLLLEPARSGNSGMQREFLSALIALGVLVALVLMIACANVANLMTAQAATRAREMALRVSIGAGRRRLVQLMLVESAELAVLAALLGGLLAAWAAPFVVGRINPADNPARLILAADWRVLAFGLGLTVCVTCLFCLTPALRASRVGPAGALKGGDDRSARGRTMHGLVAVQAAFCFIVLFVAGLFVTTFERLAHQPLGFSTERLLAVEAVSRTPQTQMVWDRMAEHLRGVPGVDQVALAAFPLLSGNNWGGFIRLNGAPAGSAIADFLEVSPGWLDTMKIPLIDGRDFRPDDTTPGFAIVNEAFAKTYFNGENPVGKWYETQLWGSMARFQIVGLARDARYQSMREPVVATAYVPLLERDMKVVSPLHRSETFAVKTKSADSMALASTLRREVARARSDFRVSNIRAQQELADQQTVRERLLAMLAVFFGAVALLLAGIGLYGVLDYSVQQRRREIGIRMAIGAQASDIARRVTAGVFAMVLAGAAGGVALGIALARSIETLLYQVKPGDPGMLALPVAAVLGAALAAAVPAVVRAIRIDPVESLRSE
jgi:predicted permease